MPVAEAGPELDYLDRQIVAVLQINPRATWRQIALAVDSTESTVKRRTERMLETGTVRTTVIADAVIPGFRVLVQIVAELRHVQSVARALAERSDVRFVAMVTGPFDVVAEMVVPSYRRLATVILEELPAVPGITHTTTETVIRNFKTGYDWSHALLEGRIEVPPQTGVPASPNERIVLDEVDRKILDELQMNGRATYAELALQCDISESMARRRVEQLFARAHVRPVTLVDPTKLGYQVELMVWLRVDLACLEEVARRLSSHPEVRYVSATSGFSDLVCEVIVESQADSYQFVTDTLGRLPGIREVSIASELVTLKRANVML